MEYYILLDNDTINDTILGMGDIEEIIARMRRNPHDVRFREVCQVCQHYFGHPRQDGTSHKVFKTPWPGDPRVNIQNRKGRAPAYQVRQVLKALEKLEMEHGIER